MLAQTYKAGPRAPSLGGWFLSEKLDGMRCFWDGGLTRGMLKENVPWANTDKDERYVAKPIATGLWSRYGNVIHAPPDYLDLMPKVPLDGELYGNMKRQDLMSKVKNTHGVNWDGITLRAFDMPCLDVVFDDGLIDVINFQKRFTDIQKWIYEDTDISSLVYIPKRGTPFTSVYRLLQKYARSAVTRPHPQMQLPFQSSAALDLVNQTLDEISEAGGEGVMLRKPESMWGSIRSHDLLKMKKTEDAEGTVIGYITGRQTNKGSKLLGKMGAMIVKLSNGKRLELSGFTDEERVLNDTEWAIEHPETICPEEVEAVHFPRGMIITFRYRGVTKDGIPQEARFWRTRQD